MNLITSLLQSLSPAGRRARLSILVFHRVLPNPDPMFPDIPNAARFGIMLDWIKAWFNVLPLDRAVAQLTEGTLPSRAAAITFDDGYADNVSVALPQLRNRGLPATFFIATGFLDGGCMWNDMIIEAIRVCREPKLDLGSMGLGELHLHTPEARRVAVDACIAHLKYRSSGDRAAAAAEIAAIAGIKPRSDLMMTSAAVRELHRAGMQIGAHSISHPILMALSRDDARHEIQESRSRLEQIVGGRVGLFAYPNGKWGDDYGAEHAQLVRESGFDAAVSTDAGAAGADTDRMRLPRFTPWDRTRFRFGARMAANLVRAPHGDR